LSLRGLAKGRRVASRRTEDERGDTGRVLGLSRQRVQQLTQDKRGPIEDWGT
jgi:hypothetical protein